MRYFISDRGIDGVSAPQFREAVGRGFDTWQAVETASVGFEFGGFVGSSPLDQDGANVIGFASRPDLERTLASTSFLIDTRTGEIIESDIFFNSTFQWSVAPGGEAGRFDVQSIATHESGHFLGLGHSSLGETEPRPTGGRRLLASNSVMFPIAFTAGNIVDRDLTADDIAGVSDIYPDGDFRRTTGTVQGTVTKNGKGVFGAHVVAFDLRSGTPGRRVLARRRGRVRHRWPGRRNLRRTHRAARRRRCGELLRERVERRCRLQGEILPNGW